MLRLDHLNISQIKIILMSTEISQSRPNQLNLDRITSNSAASPDQPVLMRRSSQCQAELARCRPNHLVIDWLIFNFLNSNIFENHFFQKLKFFKNFIFLKKLFFWEKLILKKLFLWKNNFFWKNYFFGKNYFFEKIIFWKIIFLKKIFF